MNELMQALGLVQEGQEYIPMVIKGCLSIFLVTEIFGWLRLLASWSRGNV